MSRLCRFLPIFIILFIATSAAALDCNRNGIDDLVDISGSASSDCNNNSIPDECDTGALETLTGNQIDVPLTMSQAPDPVLLVPQDAADFNGDGKPDLWGHQSSGIQPRLEHFFVYLNQGGAAFQFHQDFVVNGPSAVGNVFPYDVDKDGDMDIVFVLTFVHPSLGVIASAGEALINDGNASFTQVELSVSPSSGAASTIGLLPAHFVHPSSKDFIAMSAGGRLSAVYGSPALSYVGFDMGPLNGASRLVSFESEFNRTVIFAYNDEAVTAQLISPGDGSVFRSAFVSDALGGNPILSVDLEPGFGRPIPVHVLGGAIATTDVFGTRVRALPRGVSPAGTVAEVSFDREYDLVFFGDRFAEFFFGDGEGDFPSQARVFNPPDRGRPIFVKDLTRDTSGQAELFYGPAANGTTARIVTDLNVSFDTQNETDDDGDLIPDSCQRAVPGDFDGDRRSDLTVVRNNFGRLLWFSRFTGRARDVDPGNPVPVELGHYGDTPMAADFDGDGKVSPGVVSSEVDHFTIWTTLNGDNSRSSMYFGLSVDVPLAGYFDDDRKADRVVARSVGNGLVWFVHRSKTDDVVSFDFGLAGDTPFLADTAGEGVDAAVVARVLPSTQVVWFSRLADGTAVGPIPWGLAGDKLLPPADFDGDGKSDFAVARVVGGGLQTFVRYANGSDPKVIPFGLGGDELFLSHATRQPISELAVRRPFSGHLPDVFYRAASGAVISTDGNFGFDFDALVGSDGKIVARVGNLGGIFCQTNVSRLDGFSWNPSTSRPLYSVPPSIAAQVSSVSFFDTAGALLDSTKKKPKIGFQFVGSRRSAAQLETRAGFSGIVVQTVLYSGQAYCQLIEAPRFPE